MDEDLKIKIVLGIMVLGICSLMFAAGMYFAYKDAQIQGNEYIKSHCSYYCSKEEKALWMPELTVETINLTGGGT